jgi:diguanylate cyclase (GGDEF)-like protein
MSCGSSRRDTYLNGFELTDTEQEPAGSALSRSVELARRHLGLDAALILELTPGGEIHAAAAGRCAQFAIDPDPDAVRASGLCAAVLAGRIPHVVADGSRSQELRAAWPAHVGAFIGSPLWLSDGSPFGLVCGFSVGPRPDLRQADERFMAMVGDTLAEELDARHARRRLLLELTRTLESEDVDVAFQPVVDLSSRRVLGVEALARFPAPFQRPDTTLAAAQRLGLGLELERLVIIEAWKVLPELRAGQFLGLNLSPDALLELARRANERNDLPLEKLVIEVTEHAVVDSYGPLMEQLGPLRARGLRVAVDDAGAGYASLRHILELRPDFVKIDRSLIDGMAGDRAKRVAVGAFRSLAHDLRASVIAEGVERLEDLEVACELGIEAAQGFLLGRPTTAREPLSLWLDPSWRAHVSREPAPAPSANGKAELQPAPACPKAEANIDPDVPDDADGAPAVADPGPDPAADRLSTQWRREHAGSGVTSRLILEYVAREAGGNAVRQLLALAAMREQEDFLRDENSWFSYETKLALWAAAEQVLRDPQVAQHAGEAALSISAAAALKRVLCALGTPGLVYSNVARANAKFNWAHELVVLDRGREHVKMRFVDLAGVGYHHYDCDYTQGLLATVPELFGLPKARVEHHVCGARNDSCCEFEVRWTPGLQRLKRSAVAVAAGSAALIAAGAAVPVLLPVGGALLLAGEGALAARSVRFARHRLGVLEHRVREQDNAAERLLSSLEDLSSDLRLDEVLDQITDKAQSAVGGKEFALLLDDAESFRANRHSGIPSPACRALEAWALSHRDELRERGTIVVDDLACEPLLARLPAQEPMPLGSLCAAPLLFRDELMGVLVALAHGSTVFLPGDVATLAAYATHAAIALSNARLVERLERQAGEDPLTGLVNQRAFWDACAVEFGRARRAGESLSIVLLDLDRFKLINDEHGHPYGDQVLISVACALRATVRSYDTVARLGGEEFALLLPATCAEDARELAERARSAIAHISDLRISLSGSAGAATASPVEVSPQALLERADRALYQAKRMGRDRTVSSPAVGGDALAAFSRAPKTPA